MRKRLPSTIFIPKCQIINSSFQMSNYHTRGHASRGEKRLAIRRGKKKRDWESQKHLKSGCNTRISSQSEFNGESKFMRFSAPFSQPESLHFNHIQERVVQWFHFFPSGFDVSHPFHFIVEFLWMSLTFDAKEYVNTFTFDKIEKNTPLPYGPYVFISNINSFKFMSHVS